MDMAALAFFSGRYEGVMMVLEALYELEQNQLETEYKKIDRDYVVKKLQQLCLCDFTDGILNTYFPLL